MGDEPPREETSRAVRVIHQEEDKAAEDGDLKSMMQMMRNGMHDIHTGDADVLLCEQ